MTFQMSASDLEEIRRIFLDELKTDRAKIERLFAELAAGDESSVEALGDLFHRIAGGSHAVGLVVLGHLMGVCEDIARLAVSQPDGPLRGALSGTFQRALAAIDAALDVKVVELAPPQSVVMTAPAPAPAVAELQGGGGSGRAKILIVDDDAVSARYVDTIMRAAGMVSSYCCDPEQALRTIASELPDLIILDVAMPRINGFEICRQVRAHPALHLTPILFVTHSHDLSQRVRGLEVGGNDYLSKPFDADELVARTRAHLSRLSELRDMAIRDGLTRCFNHTHFKGRLNQELARAKRYGDGLSMCMLDIDHFKKVNDASGHSAGDAVLAQTANLIIRGLRTTDVVGRLGGEEFGMMMVRAQLADAEMVANRIRESIATNKFIVPSNGELYVELSVTVSIGVTQLAKDDTAQSLLARADSALYEAKHSGRNRVRIAI